MPDTERLYDRIADAESELHDIDAAARALGEQITALVVEFCTRFDADQKHADGYIADMVSDLVFDAAGPAYRRKVALEDRISEIEDADLRRSAPVVL